MDHLDSLRPNRQWHLLILLLCVLITGCAGLYFRSAGEPPVPPPRYSLVRWPYGEYWTGIVFNGAKIGFTHLQLAPVENATNRFDIHSEAVLRFRFLMLDKRITLKSLDRVADDLSLESFFYDYDLDGSRLKLSGILRNSRLEVEILNQGQASRQTIAVEGKLYPTSIIGLYPVLHGLEVGHQYAYQVYDGETQTVGTVTQKILAYEESDLFSGRAFKIRTKFHGQKVTTWIDEKGRPVLEMSLNGVLISGLESEKMAKRYLAQAAINKEDILLNYSLIQSNFPILEPERVTFMEVSVRGLDKDFIMPTDRLQQCDRHGEEVLCRITIEASGDAYGVHTVEPAVVERYLRPSLSVPSRNSQIRGMAREITAEARDTLEWVRALVEWIRENIERKPVDVFTALDVLSGRKAECQGHSFLYTAFARALEIPTRVVNGIVYSPDHQGFLYHTWAESLVDGRWMAVDPTFGQLPADATHIKFIEGEDLSDLLPLVDLVGRLQVRVIAVDRF